MPLRCELFIQLVFFVRPAPVVSDIEFVRVREIVLNRIDDAEEILFPVERLNTDGDFIPAPLYFFCLYRAYFLFYRREMDNFIPHNLSESGQFTRPLILDRYNIIRLKAM